MFRFSRKIYRRPTELYLHRFYLIRTPWFGVYIHKILLSDYPVPHDHPWDFITCPLNIGYLEFNKDGESIHRKPFYLAYRKAEDLHWIRKLDGRPVWTLFIRFKRRRDWGFVTPSDGWVHEKIYNSTSKPKVT